MEPNDIKKAQPVNPPASKPAGTRPVRDTIGGVVKREVPEGANVKRK